MNKEELRNEIIEEFQPTERELRLYDQLLEDAEGMEENEQYNFLASRIGLPDRIMRKVYY